MPLKSGRLTPMESRFADQFVASGNPVYSATRAGYAHPPSAATRNLQRPAVQGEIAKRTWARLENEGLPLAFDRHMEALRDRKVSGPTLVRLIGLVYQEARKAGDELGDKHPAEMSAQELYQAAERARLGAEALERELAERATPVGPVIEVDDIFG